VPAVRSTADETVPADEMMRADRTGRAGEIVRADGARPVRWIAWTLAGSLLFLCYLRLSATYPVNSDGDANVLAAWDMLHGNLLLHGWSMADVTFYTTELPQYMGIELITGLTPHVVNLAGAMTYALVILLAARLAAGGAGRGSGGERALRAAITAGIMLAPQLSSVEVLVSEPDHIGTAVPILVTLLVLDRSGQRWFVPVLAGLLLTWGQIADSLVTYAAAVPLLLVGATRAYQQLVSRGTLPERLPRARYDLTLAAAAIGSLALAPAIVALIHVLGGYTQTPLQTTTVVSATVMPQQFWMGLQDVLLLFGANIFGQPLGFGLALAGLHLIGFALAAWATAVGIRRFRTDRDLVAQVLVTGIVIMLIALPLFWRLRSTFGAHEIAPVLPMAAVLAGRLLAGRLKNAAVLPVLAVVLAGYLLALGNDAVQPPAPPASTALAGWLTDHQLRDGLGTYWQAASTMADSGGSDTVSPVIWNGKMLAPYHWESSSRWYDPALHRATFVVTAGPDQDPRWPTPGEAVASFGRPMRTYHYGPYVIQVWDKNLLTMLPHW